jgi:hypothetical protein
MKYTSIKLMAFIITALWVTGCEKKVNDWAVDPSHDRLFKPLVFEVWEPGATTVTLRYTQSVSANKYVFEFSKDSLAFGQIVKTVAILADTLTPFTESPTPAKVEYRTVFDGLDGASAYSVRMKSVDTVTGSESKYSALFFRTLSEQLFDTWDISTSRITITWRVTPNVTHISVFDPVTNAELQKIPLTDADKQQGSAEITGLTPGTHYRIIIYNNEVVRGTKELKTLGLKGGVAITVNPGDDLPAMITDAVGQGNTSITLLFQAGLTYNIGTLDIPAGVSNISFTGETPRPILNVQQVRFTDAQFGKMNFELVELVGGTGDYMINMSADNVEMEAYSFENCVIHNYRSLVRIQNKLVKLKQIIINNSMLQNIGDYGAINIGGSSVTLDSIKVTNSTVINQVTQLMDVRAQVQGIKVNNNTIYNQSKALTQLIRLDKNNLPGNFEGFNNIIAGTNNGTDLKSFSLAYDGSFAGSYRTNEMSIGQDFPNITVFNGTAADIFIDPEHGDFTLNPDSGFGGRGTAGDPRWY